MNKWFTILNIQTKNIKLTLVKNKKTKMSNVNVKQNVFRIKTFMKNNISFRRKLECDVSNIVR